MEKVNELDRFLRQVKKARNELKYDRRNFWSKNRVNFRNNIKALVSFFRFPEGWTVNVIASRFLLDRPMTMPYDQDVWSFSDVVSATKIQGKEMIIFFNKSDLEFLSLPALLPIVVHEIAHVHQVPKDVNKYILSATDDGLSKEYEAEADAEVRKYSDEFRRENILEKILFCYDEEGWKGAKKMVSYLFNEAKNAFGGGYDEEMTKEEYEDFLKAEEEKDINIFIDTFIASVKEPEQVVKM